jgi:hypothetical protein
VSSNATGGLVGRIKALYHGAKPWSRKHHACPDDYNNASFIVLLLDIHEESRVLSTGEWHLRELCHDRLALLIAQRTAYWKQRGKFWALREGEANMKFFHAMASCRARQNAIHALEVDGVQLVSHHDKM